MQTRLQSLIEAWVNVLVGLGIAIVANIAILGSMGFQLSFKQNAILATLMTIISLIRSYALRRFFNWYHGKQNNDETFPRQQCSQTRQ